MKKVGGLQTIKYTLILAGMIFLIMTLVLASCSEATPEIPGAANDDIVFPPGGFTYRANVHHQGEPDWPPVKEVDITIDALSGNINVRYRDIIESKSGETRNNIVLQEKG